MQVEKPPVLCIRHWNLFSQSQYISSSFCIYLYTWQLFIFFLAILMYVNMYICTVSDVVHASGILV